MENFKCFVAFSVRRMSANFEKIKNIKQRDKDIVNGFIKKCELLLPKNNSYYNIAQLIHYLISLYYVSQEYFTKHGYNMSLNNECNMVTTNKTHKYF